MKPQPKLDPNQNFTTGIEGIFYTDRLPVDQKCAIEEGTTYNLSTAGLETNRINGEMYIRNNYEEDDNNFHLKYAPNKTCCAPEPNSPMWSGGGCGCEPNCPTCNCKEGFIGGVKESATGDEEEDNKKGKVIMLVLVVICAWYIMKPGNTGQGGMRGWKYIAAYPYPASQSQGSPPGECPSMVRRWVFDSP